MRWLFLIIPLALGCSRSDAGSGQSSKDFANSLTQAWMADGVAIKTGFEADGTQDLAVLAKGGYLVVNASAKAGVPSVLRVYTDNTYDCSRSLVIPGLGEQALLPAKGVKEFSIPPMAKGATLAGTCGMGMYDFVIRFE